jgi:hypothetical protein
VLLPLEEESEGYVCAFTIIGYRDNENRPSPIAKIKNINMALLLLRLLSSFLIVEMCVELANAATILLYIGQAESFSTVICSNV